MFSNKKTDIIHDAEKGRSDDIEKQLKKLSPDKSRELVNKVNKDKQTALHLAVENDQPEVVKVLLQFGADPNLQDNIGETPLHIAMRKNLSEITQYLLANNAKCDIKRNDSCYPIHVAATVGAVEAAKALLDHDKFQIQLTSKEGRTALYCAAVNEKFKMMELLLGYGDNLNQQNAYELGKTLLHIAAIKNLDKLATFLVERGVDVDKLDGGKCTSLQRCAMQAYPSLETAKELIASGADVDAGDPAPIILLAENNNQGSPRVLEFAKLLVEKRCDLEVTNKHGETAFDILRGKLDKLEPSERGLYLYLQEKSAVTENGVNLKK